MNFKTLLQLDILHYFMFSEIYIFILLSLEYFILIQFTFSHFFCWFFFLMAAFVAYGSSQAGNWILLLFTIIINQIYFYFILFYYFCFLGLLPQHMEVPRLRVKLELWLPAYATATAMWDLSHICKLHHSSWDPWSTERCQGSNPHPHRYSSD